MLALAQSSPGNTIKIGEAVQSIHNKLNGIELAVSEALVRQTAADVKGIIETMNATLAGPLPGYDVRTVDGNHLAGTDHHIELIEDLIACRIPAAYRRRKPWNRMQVSRVLNRVGDAGI